MLGVILVRQLLARPLRPATPAPYGAQRSVALDELDLRYARGEIGRDEYLGRRTDLLAALGQPWPGGPPYGPPHAGPPAPAEPPPPDAPAA